MEGTMAQPEVSSGANFGSEQPGSMYWSAAHKLAFERLTFAVTSGAPMTVFVGREGTGRTRLVRELIATNTSDCVIRLMNNPDGVAGEVFSDVLSAFNPKRAYSDDINRDREELLNLLQSLHAAGRFPVLVVDDADQMSNLYLGELCELCSQSVDGRPLLKLLLVGRPGTTDILSGVRPDLTGPAFTLECLSEKDVGGFLRARLDEIGLTDRALSKNAVSEAFILTSGIPARLNRLCEGLKQNATLTRFATKVDTREIDKAQMRKIGALVRINELGQKARDQGYLDNESDVDGATLVRRTGVEAEEGPLRDASDTGGAEQPDKARTGLGIKTLFVGGVIVVLGAGMLLLLPGSQAFFQDRLGTTQGEATEPSSIQEPSSENVALEATSAPAPDLAAEAKARVALIADALATTDSTATGQYLAALDLAETTPEAATVAYARAALAGHARSAYYLGQIYETGEGIPVDLTLARAWYRLAGPQIEGAANRLDDLQPSAAEGDANAPIPLFSNRTPDGYLELVWTSGQGPDPSAYRIELSSRTDDPVHHIPEMTISAVRVAAPDQVQEWRVIALTADGDDVAASPWMAIDP
ncbi:hypothetical protein RA28_06990 [Ruegeria sp. ANG-S4]|nr:hypothetical protein RA28_06990 [Ruegeria sp. ANG-S4]